MLKDSQNEYHLEKQENRAHYNFIYFCLHCRCGRNFNLAIREFQVSSSVVSRFEAFGNRELDRLVLLDKFKIQDEGSQEKEENYEHYNFKHFYVRFPCGFSFRLHICHFEVYSAVVPREASGKREIDRLTLFR